MNGLSKYSMHYDPKKMMRAIQLYQSNDVSIVQLSKLYSIKRTVLMRVVKLDLTLINQPPVVKRKRFQKLHQKARNYINQLVLE